MKGDEMKSRLLFSTLMAGLFAGLAIQAGVPAQGQNSQLPRYTVTDLGPSGSPFSDPTFVSNEGLIAGFAFASDGTSHAVLWYRGPITDISKLGLGGPTVQRMAPMQSARSRVWLKLLTQ